MLYVYKITRDYGFAPNPFWGYCTLATCKPDIRRRSQVGDIVVGFGSNKKGKACKMICFMRITETMTFDEYWKDTRFERKKPIFTQGIQECYGDNIYHRDNNVWIQENSHHSKEGGEINTKNLIRDTGVNRVLISTEYWYFGENAITLPEEYNNFIPYWRNYKKFDAETGRRLEQFLKKNYQSGILGRPQKWVNNEFERYLGN